MKEQAIKDTLGAMAVTAKLDHRRVVTYVRYPESATPDTVYSIHCYTASNGSVRWLFDGRCINRAYLAVKLRTAEVA